MQISSLLKDLKWHQKQSGFFELLHKGEKKPIQHESSAAVEFLHKLPSSRQPFHVLYECVTSSGKQVTDQCLFYWFHYLQQKQVFFNTYINGFLCNHKFLSQQKFLECQKKKKIKQSKNQYHTLIIEMSTLNQYIQSIYLSRT